MNVVSYIISRKIFKGGGPGQKYLAKLLLIDPLIVANLDPMTLTQINEIGKPLDGGEHTGQFNEMLCKAVLLGILGNNDPD